jgi:hypothetical protein
MLTRDQLIQQQKKQEQERLQDKLQESRKEKIKEEHLKLLKNDKIVKMEQFKYIKELMKLSYGKRLHILSKSPIIKGFTSDHNYSRHVCLIQGFIVKKIIEPTSFGNFVFWNEVNALKKLLKYPHFPKLLAYDSFNLVIYMSYCGNVADSSNLPDDWPEQLNNIRNILKLINVNSNDMLVRNTCIFDGRIHIIDFGLTTQFPKNIDVSINKLAVELNQLMNIKNINNINNMHISKSNVNSGLSKGEIVKR